MKTVQYLKNYAYSYIYVILAILLATLGLSNAATYVSSAQKFSEQTVIVIDPGHGGMDGGTVSNTGISESQINLQISLRLQELMKLLGQEPIMTRTSDKSLGEDHGTVRQQKRSDLQYRVDTVNALEHALLISIHQNYFTQTQYSGPQVFSAKDPNSEQDRELRRLC